MSEDRVNADHAFAPGQLSADEATQLAAQVAELTTAGLPLAPGLRALADELGVGRLGRALRAMAAQLERGASLESVIADEHLKLPGHVRGLIRAAIGSGRLPQALQEFVEIRRKRMELRNRIRLAIAYPLVLFAGLAAVATFLIGYVVPQLAQIFMDFDADLPQLTKLVLWLSVHGIWAALWVMSLLVTVAFMLWLVPGASWARRWLYYVPLFGPLCRWSRLAECSSLIALLTEERIPLPDAMRLTAEGIADRDLSIACRRAGTRLAAGQTVAQSLASQWPFPKAMIPLVEWGERTNNLPETFRTTAELFEGRARIQGVLLETLLVPSLCVVFLLGVGVLICALFLPLISLIRALSG